MRKTYERVVCFALALVMVCAMLPAHASATADTCIIEVLNGEITAAALYAAIVSCDDSFQPRKETTGRLQGPTQEINVAEIFEYGSYSGGGVKYIDGAAEYVVGSNSVGNASVAHNVPYNVHYFEFSGSSPKQFTFGYFDTGKYIKVLFYYEPVIGSVTAQDASGNSIALPAGASAELKDNDGGLFYHNDKATISAAPVDGYAIYAGGAELAYNETTGRYELEVTITDSAAYTVVYKEKATERAANLTYTELRTDAAGNVISDGTSGMVTGATASGSYAIGEMLTYQIAPVGNWYVKSIKINDAEQVSAENFGQGRAYEVSHTITSADAVDVAVELAEKHLAAREGTQNVPFNPAKTVAQQLKAGGAVDGSNPLEKLIFEAVVASGSAGNLPAALSWDSAGISYVFKSGNGWYSLDSADEGCTFPATIGSSAQIRITWAGNAQYPEVAATGVIQLVDCRPAAPTYDVLADANAGMDGIIAAVVNAAGELGLPAEKFRISDTMQSEIDSMAAGTKKSFTLTASFDGNAAYQPGEVTVNLEVTKPVVVPAVVTLNADAQKGIVTIKNASGNEIDFGSVHASENDLTVSIEPKAMESSAYYVQSIVVTENGEEIVKTDAGVNTAVFRVKNSETANSYTVTVTYGIHELKLADTIAPVKFNPFVAAADQMTGDWAKADVVNDRSLEQSVMDALGICYDGAKLEYSDAVTITYHPWEARQEAEPTYSYAENPAVRPALDKNAESNADCTYFGFGERWVDAGTKTLTGDCKEKVTVAYQGLSVTAEITLVEGRPELVLTGGSCETTVNISSMDGRQDRSAINEAAMSVVTGSKPTETPHFQYENTDNLNELSPTDVTVTIRYDATAAYVDEEAAVVTVPVQLMEQRSTVTIAENEENGSGVAAIFDSAGNEVTSSGAGMLTLTIDPDDDGSYVADCKVTDKNGSDIPLTGSFSDTSYEGTFEIGGGNAYTVTVTYAKRTLSVRSAVLGYNRFYDGKVTQQVNEVKAALIADVLAVTGGALDAEDLSVSVWDENSGKYHNIDGTSENGQQVNMADAAFDGDSVKLQIVWAGETRFPAVTLADLNMTLRENRPTVHVTTKTYAETYPGAEPVVYKDNDEENRKRINEKALGMVTVDAAVTISPPTSYLYAADVTEADGQTPFAADFEIANDWMAHTVAVKMIWDSTAQYTGTSAVVYVIARHSGDGMLTLALDPAESAIIAPGARICIDGEPYVLDENCTARIAADAATDAVFVTAYSYCAADTTHEAYPAKMHVWYAVPTDADSDGKPDRLRTERVTQLDDFFLYEGASIRVSRSFGDIRFFTSVPAEKCEKLMQGTLLTGSLAGYRMTLAGTVFKKYNEESTNVTLANGVSSDVYGAKAGKTFRIFSKASQRNWFTGMLTGLDTDAETINGDILSRPYAILEHNGQRLTLYGGAIQRSVYYVAARNRDHFSAGSAHDNVIEKLIATAEATMHTP